MAPIVGRRCATQGYDQWDSWGRPTDLGPPLRNTNSLGTNPTQARYVPTRCVFRLVAWALLAMLFLHVAGHGPGGDVRGFKRGRGGDVPRCKGQEVTASKARLGPGTCVSRRVMARGRDAACGRSRDRAGWLRIYAPTRIRRGQHQIVFRPFGPRSGLWWVDPLTLHIA